MRHNLSNRNQPNRKDTPAPAHGQRIQRGQSSITNQHWSALARACKGIGRLKQALKV